MSSSFNSFQLSISLFSIPDYVNGKYPTLSEHYFPFKVIYEGIHEEDKKKPLFSQTTKFKKFPNNLKGYKYQKIQRDNVKIFQPTIEETDKIKITINTHLNKITSHNFEKISVLLIDDLLKINNSKLFEILGDEIYFKCKNDDKYKHIYIQLFEQISKKIDGFKEYFVNFIQKEFYEKKMITEVQTDEEEIVHKKSVLVVIDIILLLIQHKIVKIDVLHFTIINLLHLDNNPSPVHELELECLHLIFKHMEKNSLGIKHQRRICYEYVEQIEKIQFMNQFMNQSMNLFSKRTLFFIDQMKNIIRTLFPDETVSMGSVSNINHTSNDFIQAIQEKNEAKLLKSYIFLKGEMFESAIDHYFENKIPLLVMSKIINIEIKENVSSFEIKMSKMIENMEDIILDIPQATVKIKELLGEVEFPKKQSFIEVLDNLES
jgi:hypothetical protein